MFTAHSSTRLPALDTFELYAMLAHESKHNESNNSFFLQNLLLDNMHQLGNSMPSHYALIDIPFLPLDGVAYGPLESC